RYLPARLPDGCPAGALRARQHALHLVPHDRTARQYSPGTSPLNGQPDLRLRYLPASLPRQYRGGATARAAPGWKGCLRFVAADPVAAASGAATTRGYRQQPRIDTIAGLD